MQIEHIKPNFTRIIDVAGNQFWFSYTTLVGFKTSKGNDRPGVLAVRENVWGPTTGKHLNQIDGGDRGSRISDALFLQKYKNLFGYDLVH